MVLKVIRSLTFWALIAVLAPIMLACGAAATATPAVQLTPGAATAVVQSTAVPTPEPTVGAALTPKRGGILRMGVSRFPRNLDPHTNPSYRTWRFIEQIYNGLTGFTENLEVTPELAKSWEMPDSKTVVFSLREGLKFHHGGDFTSEDVKFSLERIMNPDTAARFGPSFSAAIASIDTPDTYTVQFNLKAPFTPLTDYLASPLASIVSKEFTEQNDGKLEQVASGLGPFALVEWVTGTRVEMTRNDGFWDEGLPYLDGLLYTPVTDEVARAIALKADDVDVIDYVPYPEWTSLMEAADTSVAQGNDPGYWRSIYFNLEKPPFNDVRVRQALYWAMDREEIAQIVGHGQAKAASEINVIPSSSPWHTTLGLMQFPAQDLEKAKALLAEAGLPDGFKTSIIVFPGSNWPVQSAQSAQAQWKKIGVNVELVYLSSAESSALRAKGEHAMATGGALMTIGDPDYLYEQWHSSMQAQSSLFADEEVDRLLEQGRASADPEERRQIYDQVQRRVSELVPRLIMFWIPNTAFIGKNVKGYRHTANGQMLYLRRTWLEN